MAKWGEGDPRWIVEDRPDATNVNNWHWTMKDASAWSKSKLTDFLVGLKFEDPSVGKWKIKEVTSMEGEASASNRKGNLIILYDWTIKMKIKGSSQEGKESEGTMNVANFCDENETNDIEIAVSIEKNSPSLSQSLAQQSKSTLVDVLAKYVILLKDQYSQGVILPSHNKTEQSQRANEPSKAKTSGAATSQSNTAQPVRISTKRVKLKESFKCTGEELYNVFVTEELASAFTRSKASINPHKGGTFVLMGGEITGEFTELERPQKIVKKWRSKTWSPGHHSIVVLEFLQTDDGTSLTMTQTGIPESDLERTKDGWKRFIFEPIKHTFGYGAALF